MTTRRAGAALIAILLVVSALLVRRLVIDDDGGTADDVDNSVSTTGRPDSVTDIVCITELRAVCTALEGRRPELDIIIEDAGVTLDRLAILDDLAAAPVWLTIEPYPEMVDAVRTASRADPIAAETAVVGTSPLAIAFPVDGRLDVLLAECAPTQIWRCIGDHAGERWSDLGGQPSWGTLRPSFGDVSDSAVSLASLAGGVAGYLGDADVTRSRWEADASFLPWFRRLAGASEGVARSGGTPLRTMITRPSALDAGATATFELADLGASGERVELTYPDPQMWVQAVIATPAGVETSDDLVSDVTALLGSQGWEPPAAAESPVPSAATLLALRTLWDEAT